MSWCIYRITNLINGKTYIGQHKYKKLDDSYMGSGKILKQAIKKYGIENFKKEILYSRIQYKETADDIERFAIAKERAIEKAEYNIANGGQGGNLGDVVNKKISEALKGKNKGKHHTDEVRKKMSESRIGKHHTEETKRKIGEANKGKYISEKTKKRLSESLKGKAAWNKGKTYKSKPCPEETKKKISETLMGHNVSEKTKEKLSKIYKGKHWKLIDGKRVWY